MRVCYTGNMRKIIVAATAFLFFATAVPAIAAPAVSPTRYVSCDACGFCPIVANITPVPTCAVDTRPIDLGGNPVPANWSACVKCLYPGLYGAASHPTPGDCNTVRVIGSAPPTTYPGNQYTMLGCLTTSNGDVFAKTSATGASTFVQAIFDLLVFRVVGGIAFLYLMYGAFIVMTSQSDPEKLNYGKRVIIGAVVGLLFALGSVFIVNLIGSGILKIPGFG